MDDLNDVMMATTKAIFFRESFLKNDKRDIQNGERALSRLQSPDPRSKELVRMPSTGAK
jgi:hypothetical protein